MKTKNKQLTHLVSLIIVCSVCFLFTTCKKEAEPANQNQTPVEAPTYVSIYVKDEAGNKIQDAKVFFHATSISTGPKMTDANGNVIFTLLPNAGLLLHPYWTAEKGCKTNWNENFSGVNLNLRELNEFNTIIYETGAIKLVITDTATYSIATSFYTGLMIGIGAYNYFPYAGPLVFHSEKTYVPGTARDTIVQIACGDTALIDLSQ